MEEFKKSYPYELMDVVYEPEAQSQPAPKSAPMPEVHRASEQKSDQHRSSLDADWDLDDKRSDLKMDEDEEEKGYSFSPIQKSHENPCIFNSFQF